MSDCINHGSAPSFYGYGRVGHDSLLAHREAWKVANGPIPAGGMILHRCNNRMCVNVDHLYLGDNSANMRDRAAAGTGPGQKLRPDDVLSIRQLISVGVSLKNIAAFFGVSQSLVSNIKAGRKWGWV